MFGWLGTAPMGVAGAGLASLIAIVVGTVWLAFYFFEAKSYLKLHRATSGRTPACGGRC